MRIILVILLLAGYGAYSLFSGFFNESDSQAASETVAQSIQSTTGFSLNGVTDLATSAVASVAGVDVKPIPDEGCTGSILSPTKALELVNSMPEPQRSAVAKLLDMSAGVWTAQLYSTTEGTGLCLPQHGKVVRLPVGVNLEFLKNLNQ